MEELETRNEIPWSNSSAAAALTASWMAGSLVGISLLRTAVTNWASRSSGELEGLAGENLGGMAASSEIDLETMMRLGHLGEKAMWSGLPHCALLMVLAVHLDVLWGPAQTPQVVGFSQG